MAEVKNKNKGGRPRLADGEHRNNRVEVAFAKSELEYLDSMRPCSGTRASFIRNFVLDGKQPEYREPVKPMTPELRKFQVDTARAFNNLNQIARALNGRKDGDISSVLMQLIEIQRTLELAYSEFKSGDLM